MKKFSCICIIAITVIFGLTTFPVNSEATPAHAQKIFDLTDGQHVGLAYDGTFFYLSSRKDDGNHLRKYDFIGNLIFDVNLNDLGLSSPINALEYIDNTLYGIHHVEPPELVIFNKETGGIDSISYLQGPVMNPVGLAKPNLSENEFYVLGYDDSKPFSFIMYVYDENWNYFKAMEYAVGLQVNGVISGLTSIGQDLYITIYRQNLMWKLHPHVEGFVIDIYSLPFTGSAALTTDGTHVYSASALRVDQQPSIYKISLASIPSSNSIHIHSILPETANGSKGREIGKVTVTVVDESDNAVPGAYVTGTFSGSFNETPSPVVTNNNGVAVIITSDQIKKPSYSFCVDGVNHETLLYKPSDNVETCGNFY